MIAAGLYQPKIRKKDKASPLREHRPRRGKLVERDGSYHAWLEDREKKLACCCLSMTLPVIVATNLLEHESNLTYARLCKHYICQQGLPEAFFTDHLSVFRANQTNVTTTAAQTKPWGRL